MAKKDGFDSEKRWGNSAMKGYGVNSPAMMGARSKALEAKKKASAVHKNLVTAKFPPYKENEK